MIDYLNGRNLGLVFNEVAKKFPDNIALKYKDQDFTYQQLNQKSNQLAHFFLSQGIKNGDVILLAGTKQFPTFCSIFACLKIGAAYSIFDAQSPSERLGKIIDTCKPKLCLINEEQEKFLDIFLQNNAVVFFYENLLQKIVNFPSEEFKEAEKIDPKSIAYIMFTSGSTGIPKGATITQKNLTFFINWAVKEYKITPQDISTNVNALYFDNSVFDIYPSLFSGACLVPFEKEESNNPKILVERINKFHCSIWFSVPSLLIFLDSMRAFNQTNLRSISRFIFGGEGYPKAKLKKLFDTYKNTAELHNVSGPTECTCICSTYKISEKDFEDLSGFPPIGKINDYFSYLVLDENGRKVEDGFAGELCLGGPSVGLGYYNDIERTQKSFIKNPDPQTEIIYKTGDIVRYNPLDKKIYILGRKDNQVKHMGYRIELEEIETALSKLSYINQAAVLYGNSSGVKKIIAIVATHKNINEEIVRNDLKSIIPDYMIPSSIYFMEELPKSANAKVDKIFLTKKFLDN